MFQRAHALAPSPRTLGQMGLVEASLEHWLDAETHLTGVAGDAGRPLGPQEPSVPRSGVEGQPGPHRRAGHHRPRRHRCRRRWKTRRHVAGRSTGEAGRRERGRDRERRRLQGLLEDGRIEGGAKMSLAIVLDPVEKRPAVALAAPVPLPASSPPLPSVTEHRGRTLENGGRALASSPPAPGCWRGASSGSPSTTTTTVRRAGRLQQGLRHQDRRLDSDRRRCRGSRGGRRSAAHWGHRGESPNVAFGATPTSLLLRARF